MPKNAFRPLSTPLNPMKAMANRPAVTRAMLIPCMPFGTDTRLSCSRMPAKMTRAKPKPKAVLRAYHTPIIRLNSFWMTKIATPSTAQLVVIRGKNTPKAW